MKFSLRQIEVFLALCHHQNMTRAASQLAMSQSAASSSLKELEQQFDAQLFDRIGKRLQINERGRLLQPSAEALMEQAQEVEALLAGKGANSLLKVGATLTIGNYLAVGIMAKMMQKNAGAEVSLSVANTSEITAKVLNFELDIGLIEGEIQHPDLEVIEWCDDQLVVFCAPHHPLAKAANLSEQQLINAPWILREQGSGTRQTFDRAMHGLLPQLHIAHELQHTEAIKRAVEANLGIGCLSKVTLQEAFKRGSLIPLIVKSRDFSRKFYFVLHRKKYRSASIGQWIDLCRHANL
ncbi:LysR family transcriptional regulator [gamma proteobacterium IMCC2047]|nr:LysR family transcriptional regulator [gamma proteobacterium IMCC2047]